MFQTGSYVWDSGTSVPKYPALFTDIYKLCLNFILTMENGDCVKTIEEVLNREIDISVRSF